MPDTPIFTKGQLVQWTKEAWANLDPDDLYGCALVPKTGRRFRVLKVVAGYVYPDVYRCREIPCDPAHLEPVPETETKNS